MDGWKKDKLMGTRQELRDIRIGGLMDTNDGKTKEGGIRMDEHKDMLINCFVGWTLDRRRGQRKGRGSEIINTILEGRPT